MKTLQKIMPEVIEKINFDVKEFFKKRFGYEFYDEIIYNDLDISISTKQVDYDTIIISEKFIDCLGKFVWPDVKNSLPKECAKIFDNLMIEENGLHLKIATEIWMKMYRWTIVEYLCNKVKLKN